MGVVGYRVPVVDELNGDPVVKNDEKQRDDGVGKPVTPGRGAESVALGEAGVAFVIAHAIGNLKMYLGPADFLPTHDTDFFNAYFPGWSYTAPQNYDFVYHANNTSDGSWVYSNAPNSNPGNITG